MDFCDRLLDQNPALIFTTPNQCILTHVGAHSLTHAPRKPLCDFLSCGFRFSNEMSRERGAKCLLLSSPPVLSEAEKLSEKHFTLGVGALCPCEKDFKEVILFYFFFLLTLVRLTIWWGVLNHGEPRIAGSS